jgi:hypothetical protein
MNLASIIKIGLLIIYHQDTDFFDWKVLVFCETCFLSACYLYAIYPQNETLSLVDPVPPKARILEVWVLVTSTKCLVKNWFLDVFLGRCYAGSVHSYIGGYLLQYVVIYKVIHVISITYIPFSQNWP